MISWCDAPAICEALDRWIFYANWCSALLPVDADAEQYFDRVMAQVYAAETCTPITRRCDESSI